MISTSGHSWVTSSSWTSECIPLECSVHNLLTFLEYLFQNCISPKVISTSFSSIHSKAKLYGLDVSSIAHPAVQRYIRSISINSRFAPTPRGIFDIRTLYNISLSCDILSDPIFYRAIFLTVLYGFLRMSNIAPHGLAKFSWDHHFLKQDLIFAPPGAHLLNKWTKTPPAPQIPSLDPASIDLESFLRPS